MNKGIDVSTYMDVVSRGKKYYDESGHEMDPLDAFIAGGVDWMRLRLWNDPYGTDGAPYNGGTNDAAHMIELAKLARDKGFHLALDFHYSDFWTDPKKQTLPKAWSAYSMDAVKDAMRQFTLDTLRQTDAAGLHFEMIQVGNEVTNGMLWPYGFVKGDIADGPRTGYEGLIDLLRMGIAAVREGSPSSKIILHLEQSGNAPIYDEWFSHMAQAGVDYDVIGMSYYPFWHGNFAGLWANVDACKKKFGKEVAIVEWSYAFTLRGYLRADGTRVRLSAGENAPVELYLPYPPTEAGQAEFVREFVRGAKEHGVLAAFYWEPLWLPGDGIRWASDEGLSYIEESGKSTENEWANQCMFDYEGHKLSAFAEYCSA